MPSICLSESPNFGYIPCINKKRRGILYSLIPPSGLRIAFPKDKQRISPRRAVYRRPLLTVLREMLHFVQHDKMRVHSHEQGVINARSGRFRCRIFLGSKLRSLTVEDNVRKRPFSKCIDPPPTRGLMSQGQR